VKTLNPELRPIGARALKSASDTLRPYLQNSVCLDLYAGLGRWGQMALKEGAAEVTFVEKAPSTARDLSKAVSKELRAKVVNADTDRFLQASAKKPYDIVFADPPFPFWNENFFQVLSESVKPWLNVDSIFLVKHPSRVVLSAAGFALWKQTGFGEATLTYFLRQD
jgi:16S rRNA (guanine966-N2)-methyltransferase